MPVKFMYPNCIAPVFIGFLFLKILFLGVGGKKRGQKKCRVSASKKLAVKNKNKKWFIHSLKHVVEFIFERQLAFGFNFTDWLKPVNSYIPWHYIMMAILQSVWLYFWSISLVPELFSTWYKYWASVFKNVCQDLAWFFFYILLIITNKANRSWNELCTITRNICSASVSVTEL